MLKQQLQKTKEEFNEMVDEVFEFYYAPNGDTITMKRDPDVHENLTKIKQFIHQAQIDAVKAFAEEMTTHVNENYSRSSQPLNAHIDAKGVVDKINSLLKEINI